MGKRETETDTHRYRQTKRRTYRSRHTEADRETNTRRIDRGKQIETDTDREIETDRERDRERDRQRQIQNYYVSCHPTVCLSLKVYCTGVASSGDLCSVHHHCRCCCRGNSSINNLRIPLAIHPAQCNISTSTMPAACAARPIPPKVRLLATFTGGQSNTYQRRKRQTEIGYTLLPTKHRNANWRLERTVINEYRSLTQPDSVERQWHRQRQTDRDRQTHKQTAEKLRQTMTQAETDRQTDTHTNRQS